MLETVLVFFISLLVLVWWRSRPRNPLPTPGLALPIVGHLHLFRIEQLPAWRKRLGDIYSLQLGSFPCVMLNGYDLIFKVLLKQHESLLERPNNFLHKDIFEHHGIASLGGEHWKEQRAFLQSLLRAFGVGRNIMEERIEREADYLLSTIDAAQGEPLDMSGLVMVSVNNVICGVIFNKRFNQEDKIIVYWLGFVKRLFQLLVSSAALNYFPILKYAPLDIFHYKELKSISKSMRETIWSWVDRDNRKINLTDEAFEDIVQAFLTEMERKKEKGIVNTSMNEANLMSTLLSLFIAGSETIANTIVFAVLYMVNFPHLQDQLFREIDDVIGIDRPPSILDKSKVKFFSAFIMETQRFAGVVPIAIDRLATKDIHLDDYTIPKGSTVMVNLDSVLRDESAWGDPNIFRPDRFLDADGSVIVKKELIPFGIGKRNCLGDALASMELFLFIGALVQKFEFLPEKDNELPTLVPNVGITRVPKPFKVRAIRRQK